VSSNWTQKAKVLTEIGRAQRRLVELTNTLHESHNPAEAKCLCCSGGSGLKVMLMAVSLLENGNGLASATMIAMVLKQPLAILERFESGWGRLVEILHQRDQDEKTLQAAFEQLSAISLDLKKTAVGNVADQILRGTKK
jgi:hypothetical protein